MFLVNVRVRSSIRAAVVHLGVSFFVAGCVAALVFGAWYPYPYRELAGGRELFLLIAGVDMVCGPLLTLILYSPRKMRAEIYRDLGLVVLIQFAALSYGSYVLWQARPVYLVHEVDRFKVIALPSLEQAEVKKLPSALHPRWVGGPITVAIRPPESVEEKNMVLFEALQGGRDYAERAEFYVPYEGEAALRSLDRAKALSDFLRKQPAQNAAALNLISDKKLISGDLKYLPVVGRKDWIAVLDSSGKVVGFLEGDGF